MTELVVTPRRLPGFFNSLRYRDFRLLWATVLFSSSGQWMEQVVLGWLAYEMTGSAYMLGVIVFLRAIPIPLFSPVGNFLVGKYSPKKMMLVGQSIIVILIFTLAVLVFLKRIEVWQLFAVAFLVGMGWSFLTSARQILIPIIVAREDLTNAATLISVAFQAARIFGPVLAGFLIGLIGVGGTLFIEVIVYAVAALVVPAMTIPKSNSGTRHLGTWQGLWAGLKYVSKSPLALGLSLLTIFPVIFGMPYSALMPVFARDVLNAGASGLGILVSAPGVGALAAGFVLASFNKLNGRGMLLLASDMAFGISLIGFALSSWLPMAFFFLILLGLSSVTFLAIGNHLLEATVSDETRDHVAEIHALDTVLVPIGSLIAGYMASTFGSSASVAFMGITLSIFIIIISISVPALRRLE